MAHEADYDCDCDCNYDYDNDSSMSSNSDGGGRSSSSRSTSAIACYYDDCYVAAARPITLHAGPHLQGGLPAVEVSEVRGG